MILAVLGLCLKGEEIPALAAYLKEGSKHRVERLEIKISGFEIRISGWLLPDVSFPEQHWLLAMKSSGIIWTAQGQGSFDPLEPDCVETAFLVLTMDCCNH